MPLSDELRDSVRVAPEDWKQANVNEFDNFNLDAESL